LSSRSFRAFTERNAAGQPLGIAESNLPKLQARIAAINLAVQRLQDLKAEGFDANALSEIEASIPPFDADLERVEVSSALAGLSIGDRA
jgi:hypothetical protein